MTDEDADKLMVKLEAALTEETRRLFSPTQEQRMTALRLHGTSFETVTFDGEGLVIEPVRCTCYGVVVNFECPLHKGGVT